MDTSLKYQIIERVIKSKNDCILEQIYELLNISEKNDTWDNLPTPVKSAISQAEKELDEGKGIAHDEVMKEINSHF